MGVTPVSMSEDGFNFNQSTTAIVGHMLGMFVPSLFTGHLVAKTGPYRFMMFGFLVLLFGSLLFLVDRSLAIYTTGILIVGVGWNFSFIPASAIFTTFFTSAERGYVVGFNEFIVIGSVGIITATAGTIFEKIGSWNKFVAVFSCYIGVSVILCSFEVYKVHCKSKLTNE